MPYPSGPPFLSAFSSFSSFFTSSFTFSSLMPSFSRFAACSARAFCTNSSASNDWGHAELGQPLPHPNCSAHKETAGCRDCRVCRGLPCLKSEGSKRSTHLAAIHLSSTKKTKKNMCLSPRQKTMRQQACRNGHKFIA